MLVSESKLHKDKGYVNNDHKDLAHLHFKDLKKAKNFKTAGDFNHNSSLDFDKIDGNMGSIMILEKENGENMENGVGKCLLFGG